MLDRAKRVWPNLSQNLGFIPGLIVAAFALVGIVLVQVDGSLDLDGVDFVFQGNEAAARTVLSVIAGSLITVAGLTFSITIVVLQLTSSQFSPRILRSFFGDRVTQITIGTYVGIFVYSILVLRAVGTFGEDSFVPRLSITLASLFGIGAVILLVVFLHHVSQQVQVSHVTATVARRVLERLGSLYPQAFDNQSAIESPDGLLREWRASAPGLVMPERPGFVQRVDIASLGEKLAPDVTRVAVLVCPGDFVSVDQPLAEVWPAEAAERCERAMLEAVTVANERDLTQDIDFGVRQLADTAIKAMSPGINDPTTAVTCVDYLRSILVRLAGRAEPESVARPQEGLTLIARHRGYEEYLDAMLQLNRYVGGDAWVIDHMLAALAACARTATECGASDRASAARAVAATIAEQGEREVGNDRDRAAIRARIEAL